MTEPSLEPVSAPPQCPGCGYLLTGLAPQGQCPECGRRYNVDLWARFEKRPLFGVGCTFLPPLAAATVWPVLFLVFVPFGCAIIPFGLFLSVIWSWLAADRVAGWQYSCAVAESVDDGSLQNPAQWIATRRRRILVLQILGIMLALPSPWVAIWVLDALGYHVGWS